MDAPWTASCRFETQSKEETVDSPVFGGSTLLEENYLFSQCDQSRVRCHHRHEKDPAFLFFRLFGN